MTDAGALAPVSSFLAQVLLSRAEAAETEEARRRWQALARQHMATDGSEDA